MLEPQQYQWVRHVRYLRDRMGLTQQQFGDRLGVTGQTVYRWEAGISSPSPRIRQLIVRMLDTHRGGGKGAFDFHLLLKSAIVEIPADRRIARIRQHRTLVANVSTRQYLWEFYSDGDLEVLDATPGAIVGEYHKGAKTYTTQDVGRTLTPGETVDVALQMEARDSFPADTEWHGLEVSEPMHSLRMQIRFSIERAPIDYSADIVDGVKSLDATASISQRQEGDWVELDWGVEHPALFSTYTLRWRW